MNYAYIRVSTDVQSYESQEFEIKNWCARKNIHVDRWVSESVSGTVDYKKRALGHAMRRMDKGDCIICTEISRLGRSMLMIMSVLNDCAAKGIRIYTIKDRFELSDNINSKIIAFAFALAAEIERNLISQRTKEALAAKRQSGVKLGRPVGPSAKFLRVKAEAESIRKELMDNIPLTKIAARYGVHRNTLRRYLKSIKE
ncbi:MAG: recombinase family protein [Candidatus Cryptobacteroides sp.]